MLSFDLFSLPLKFPYMAKIFFFLNSGDPPSQSQKEIFIFTAAMCYVENIINFNHHNIMCYSAYSQVIQLIFGKALCYVIV